MSSSREIVDESRRLDFVQYKVVAGIPSLTDQVELTVVNVWRNIVQMVGQLDPEVLFRANSGQEFIGLCIYNVDRRRTKLVWIVA